MGAQRQLDSNSGTKIVVNFLWENLFRYDKKTRTIRATLRENLLFKGLSEREIIFIENIIHERHFRAGESIFRQGEIGVGMYIVAKGSVEITTLDATRTLETEAKEVFVTRLGEGDFFGEISLVEEDGRRSASARAIEDTILIGFFKPDLLSLLESNPNIGVKVIYRLAEVLGRRLKETTDRISHLKSQIRQGQPEGSEKSSDDTRSPSPNT